MAGYQNNRNNNQELFSWIIVVLALAVFWPVGLILLFRKLTHSKGKGSAHPADAPSAQSAQRQEPGTQGIRTESGVRRRGGAQAGPIPSAPPKTVRRRQPYAPGKPVHNEGRGLIVGGGIMAGLFGFVSFTELVSMVDDLLHGYSYFWLEDLFIPMGVCGVGLVLLLVGAARNKKSRRFRKYLALIGRQEAVSVQMLAQAMPVPVHQACDDLQEMLDRGFLPVGYLDMSVGRLILSDEGLQEKAEPEPEPERTPAEDERILAQIRAVNDAIEDEEMSRKIDRIEEITRKIFSYQKKKPEKAGQLRTFLNYYLPTTLKILNAYAQMEEQGVEGANITAAKERIEGMMDKVVEGFEKQLDRLFENEAMDITTDVQVLEQMLEKDGLSQSQQWEGLTLNG